MLSTDNDRFPQWQANLRVLEVTEIKTVPDVPLSHPFVGRLIGTVRRECLDRTLFWTTTDQDKLLDFQHYYNEHRTHAGCQGQPPDWALPIAHEQISVVIDGRSIVEAYTKRRLLHDLVIRQQTFCIRQLARKLLKSGSKKRGSDRRNFGTGQFSESLL